MPLYEYECDACGARFELIRKFSDPPLETCRACGAAGIRKLLSSPAVQFKGTGWYVTDYAKKSGSAPAGKAADTKAEAKSDSASTSSSSSSDSTPAPAAPKDKQS